MLSHERCSDQFYKNKDEGLEEMLSLHLQRNKLIYYQKVLQNARVWPFLQEDVGDDNDDDYEDDGKGQGSREMFQGEPSILVLASHMSM